MVINVVHHQRFDYGNISLRAIHTRHFRTQYFDKKIKKDILIKRYFFLQNIVMTFQNI